MFLYLAYQNVHQPQQAPAEYETQYEFIQNKQRRTLAGRSCILPFNFYILCGPCVKGI